MKHETSHFDKLIINTTDTSAKPLGLIGSNYQLFTAKPTATIFQPQMEPLHKWSRYTNVTLRLCYCNPLRDELSQADILA
jgi:hypothetical protein